MHFAQTYVEHEKHLVSKRVSPISEIRAPQAETESEAPEVDVTRDSAWSAEFEDFGLSSVRGKRTPYM